MKKEGKRIHDLFLRYAILLIVGIIGIKFFYFILTPLTIYPVLFLLSIFFKVSLSSNVITINHLPIEIIGACVAGSAYFLLLILTLATSRIELKRRIKFILFTFLSLLLVNILRIFTLSILFVKGVSFFDIAHKFIWYAGSTIFVIAIWFIGVKIFHIKSIPFYSDIKYLSELRKETKNSKSSKRN